VADVQNELSRLGYDPGPVDGQYGPQTRTAIKTYQEDYNLVVDGRASKPLLDHMVQQGGGPTG
jgi:peptidoglycan hydrolase-like protein with peptidoglycan-binding domain